MLPSVESLLAWRVILVLISAAAPTSSLRWNDDRGFFPPSVDSMEWKQFVKSSFVSKCERDISLTNTIKGAYSLHQLFILDFFN